MSLQFIIDGYNITNHHLFKNVRKKSVDRPTCLINLIKSKKLCGSLKNKITIVFDGHSNKSEIGCFGNYDSLLFSREKSADEVIKQLVEKSGDKPNLIVVSNDRELSSFSKLCGVKSMSVEDFLEPFAPDSLKIMKSKKRIEESSKNLNYSQINKINEELKNLWLK